MHEGYVDELFALGRAHGLHHVGVATADVLHRARRELYERRSAGLHDGMQFTYRNPDRSTDPGSAVAGARAVLVGARSYDLEPPPRPAGAVARVARYAWLDHYADLRVALRAVAARLRADGWKAVAFADDNSMVDREIAYRAGIGWFGKNANVLVPGHGSYVVLGSVVTTAPLPSSAAPVDDRCGSCRRCIDHCPTQAIVAPGVVDAARCLAWVLQKPGVIPTRLRAAVGDRIYGCDDCQEVCPPTIHAGRRRAADQRAATSAWVDVVALLAMDDADLLERFGNWYLAGRELRWLRRNALVVVGNVGAAAPDQRAVRATLGRYLGHADAMLRAHAVWAAAQLGMGDMLPDDDPDADVRAELAAAGR